jgi:hypothetical protein
MRNLFFLLFCGISISTFSQNSIPCQADLDRKFGTSSFSTVVLNRLGTSPQFGEIPQHTSESAFSHLNKVYKTNFRGAKRELDQLFVMLGYTGFKDPNFNVSKITPEIIPAGTNGNMGRFSNGFKYTWSTLGNDFPAYRIAANNSDCFIYIMKKCGNVFYVPSKIVQSVQKFAPPVVDSSKLVHCAKQMITINAKGDIESGDVANFKENVTILGKYNGQTVNLGTYAMNVRSNYDFKVNATGSTSKEIEVCRTGQKIAAPMNLNLPVNLGFNLSKQNVKIGENGTVVVNLDQKQFATLSSVFGKLSQTTSTTESTSSTDLTKKETREPISSGAGIAGNGQCTTQSLSFKSNNKVQDFSSKNSTQNIMVLGMYRKTGKLALGESADKYLSLACLGVPVNQVLQYDVTSKVDAATTVDICNNSLGSGNTLEVPLNVKYNITNQDVAIGDLGRVIVPLTEKQYNQLSKSFSRCCSNGATGCN